MAFDKDKPSAPTSLKVSNPEILANNTALQDAISFDHDFEGTSALTQTGGHDKVTLIEAVDIGTGSEGLPILGAQTVSGKAELVFADEANTKHIFTTDGALIAPTPTIAAHVTPKTYVDTELAAVVGTETDGQSTPTTTGYQIYDVQGSLTKVYTKFLTGVTAGASPLNVAHGLNSADDILDTRVTIEDDGSPAVPGYHPQDHGFLSTGSSVQYNIVYDDTNIILRQLGTDMITAGNKYRIKIEYTA